STYAPTIATLLERNYAERIEGRRFKPTEIAFMVNDFLMEHFPNILDYHFTARMEEDLDDIAEGSKEWVPVVRAFYDPFSQTLAQKKETLVKESQKEMITDERCDRCGKPMAVKFSRFGKFLACTGFPECKGTKSLKSSGRESSSISTGTTCPKCGKGEIVSRRSKRGKIFWSCNTYPACDFALWKKPTGATCLICKSLMVEGTKGKIYCSNPECSSKQKTS
ncbi:topoisomerase DNA-binding C4 zinc finger domain-containing protein, partial [Candidatus Uhrbacteria bacterium]|nr:topoisomerase DNA-binding C4 zinc finger domain-containing protein [Candidatus Uhrbacteria bacterium]